MARELNKYVLVKDDLYHIAKRLKEVDGRYMLFFNRAKHRFEIHAEGALQVAVPFDRLDERTVRLARETRLENAQKTLLEIEKHNARLELNHERDTRDKIMAQLENAL